LVILATEEFESLAAVRQLTAAWKSDYNHRRPHGSLGYVTAVEFAVRRAASAPALATPEPPLQQHGENSLTHTFKTSGTGI